MAKIKLIIGGSVLDSTSLIHWYLVNRATDHRARFFANSEDLLVLEIALKCLAVRPSELPKVLLDPGSHNIYQRIVDRIECLDLHQLLPSKTLTKDILQNIGTKHSDNDDYQDYINETYEHMLNTKEFIYIDNCGLIRWQDLPQWIASLNEGCENSDISEDAQIIVNIRNADHIGPGHVIDNTFNWTDLISKLNDDYYLNEAKENGTELYFLHTPGYFLSSPKTDSEYEHLDYYHKTWLWKLGTKDFLCYDRNKSGWPMPSSEECEQLLNIMRG